MFNRPALTIRQRDALNAISQYKAKNDGNSPSVRELCELLKINSTNAASDLLRALQSKGYIDRDPHKARALRVIV